MWKYSTIANKKHKMIQDNVLEIVIIYQILVHLMGKVDKLIIQRKLMKGNKINLIFTLSSWFILLKVFNLNMEKN